MDPQQIFNALSIVLIDLILGGDNAVVIAMAVRGLPKEQRMRGIAIGAGAAVVLRVALTFFAARLLQLRFVQLVGGALVLWIAVNLFSGGDDDAAGKEVRGFWKAIGYIVVADITMSTDNVLAIAAASHGSLPLLIFGLSLSIPFVVFTSSLLSTLMEKYPAIVYLGAGILGKVGAEMMLTDPWVRQHWAVPPAAHYAIELAAALGVLLIGRLLNREEASPG